MTKNLEKPTKSGMEQFLRKIHQVSVDYQHDPQAEIVNLLNLGASEFGFDLSVITSKNCNKMVVNYTTDKDTLPVGLDIEFGNSFCSEVVKSVSPLMIEDVVNSKYSDHPGHTDFGIKSYLGHPICFNSGEGSSLCFLNLQSKPMDLGSEIPEHLVLLAQRIEALIERIAISRRLQQSEELFRTTFEYANLGIAHLSCEGKLLNVNNRLMDFLKYSEAELLSKSFIDLTHPDDLDECKSRIGAALAGEYDHFSAEKRCLRKDGSSVWAHLTWQLIRDDEGEPDYFIALVEDIDSRVSADQERQQFEESVQEAQKLESLGVLAGGIAHDFNNLLTSIMGNANLLQNALGKHSPLYSQAENIEKASIHAADLTSQLLAYAGKGQFQIQAIDVTSLIDDMRNLLTTAVSKRVQLQWMRPAEALNIDADTGQIRQVLMNLITNASESYGDGEGEVVIEAFRVSIGKREIIESQWTIAPEQGEYVAIRVSDTGCGMDSETQRRLFEPFYTRKFVGRGLGLSAVLGIIRSHDGGLRFESTPNAGTVIEVLFKDRDIEYGKTTDQDGKQQNLPSSNILVVDDEEDVREITSKMLAARGYDVITAESGNAALELIPQLQNLKFVLLDVSMPGITVGETLEGIRAHLPAIPVIIMSGFNEQHVSKLLQENNNVSFLKKPFSMVNMFDMLAEMEKSQSAA